MQHTKSDVETPSGGVRGYPPLATFIASGQDRSPSIYRSFHELSTRNLLYLEAELSELQLQQQEYDQRDLLASRETKEAARSWRKLCGSTDPEQEKRLKLIRDIWRLMKEYRMFCFKRDPPLDNNLQWQHMKHLFWKRQCFECPSLLIVR